MSDLDYGRLLFGEHAVHVPVWMYVQHQGPDMVSFVGSSKRSDMRFGSNRSHQFVIGELLIRPHLVVATDALQGSGLSALATGSHDINSMLSDGEILIDTPGRFNARRTA